MYITARQEQFSRSAVFAIASRAGCAVSLRNVDDDSIDVTFCSKLLARRPSLDAQLKCTSRDILDETEARYFLGKKNYDDLRLTELLTPRILILMLVPAEIDHWLVENEDELSLRHCCYWRSLRGFPPTANATGETIAIPRTNLFTAESLSWMMEQINEGVDL